jgi:short-subunit dehydrogenase
MKIVITGATAGIGLGCARAFCEDGHSVIGIARSEQTLNQLTSELQSFTGIACDIADDASISTLTSRLADATGDRTVDVLINNAGYGATGPVELVTIQEGAVCRERVWNGRRNASCVAVSAQLDSTPDHQRLVRGG